MEICFGFAVTNEGTFEDASLTFIKAMKCGVNGLQFSTI